MKKYLYLFLVSLCFCLGACSNTVQQQTKLDTIKQAGKLTVGLSPDYPPYEFYIGENGSVKIVGSDVELAQKIADKLGVQLEIVALPFDSLLAALNSSRVDMVISGMNPSEERKKVVDFSNTYYVAGSVFVQRENDTPIRAVKDLFSKKIGVQKGTIQEKYLLETVGLPQENLQSLPDVTNLLQDLKNQQIDLVFLAEDVSQISISKQPGLILSTFKFEKEAESDGIAIAFKKENNATFIEAVNTVIDEINATNLYTELLTKYGKMVSE